MLQKQSVNLKLFELLVNLMNVPEFKELYLVGGTSLALQLGHRKSIDIDLFGKIGLEEFEISKIISKYGNTILLKKSENIFIYSVEQIKVDLVNYPFNWIDTPLNIEGIRLAGKKDIAAMKLNAIAGRGSKKDFIDLHFLLQEFSLKELISFYNNKYPNGSEFMVLKSLAYFDDADEEPDCIMLLPVTWEKVKKNIILELKQYLNA